MISETLTPKFVNELVKIVQELHQSGFIKEQFNKEIPIIIHELEYYDVIANKKSHLLNCKCDMFVNITSPTQLQDGTTYDSNNIIHHICMKSTEIYSEISAFSSISSSIASSLLSQVVNFSFTGYEKFLPIFWKPYSVK